MASKDRWKKWLGKALSFGKSAGCWATKTAAVACALGAIIYSASRATELHDLWLRSKVGSRVYTVQIAPAQGGGTGFAVKAKSGQTYLLTNDHICNHAKDAKLWITDSNGRGLWRRVIERSDVSDICVVEGMPGDEGLSLADLRPGNGSKAWAVGHPLLRPLVLSQGEINGMMDVKIPDHIMNPEDANDKCSLPKNEIVEVDLWKELLGIEGMPKMNVCLIVTKNAYMSNVVIFPGNSGSPVVDFWGDVEGIAFAADGTNWAMIVSLSDVRDTLLKY